VTKMQAFLRHFTMSAIIVGIALAIVFFIWYPAPYFQIAGAWSVIQILVGVDLILGPLLTLILYRAGKPGLLFDLCFIALIQLSALSYGISVIYAERPYFTVFVIDRFEVWAKKDIEADRIQDEFLKHKPWIGPIYTIAEMPKSDAERAQILEGVFAGKPDLDRLPEYWSPYADKAELVTARGMSLQQLKANHPDAAAEIDAVISQHGDSTELIGLPVIGKDDVYVLVLDGINPKPVDMILVNPWIIASTDAPAEADATPAPVPVPAPAPAAESPG
jgi:hypothetical protein